MSRYNPGICSNNTCGRVGKLVESVDDGIYVDTQIIQLQEIHDMVTRGALPESLTIYLEDDIVGKIYPGDHVIMNGIIRNIPKKDNDTNPQYDRYFECMTFEKESKRFSEIVVSEEEEKEIIKLSKRPDIFELLVDSFAPSIFENGIVRTIKESLVLQMFSGVQEIKKDKFKQRGDIHILLLGDPGTAKSQLLLQSMNVAPRSVLQREKERQLPG